MKPSYNQLDNYACVAMSYLRWVDTNIDRGTVCFFSLNSFDINNKLLSVTGHNFSNLLSLVVAAYNL